MADLVVDLICVDNGALGASPGLVRPGAVASFLRSLARHVEGGKATGFTLTWDGDDVTGTVSDADGPIAFSIDLTP